jgi:hypothetical protein
MPELAVLTTGGTYVLAADGTVLSAYAQPATGGILKALHRDTPPSFVQLRNTGTEWRVETFLPQGTFAPVDGGTLPVQSPVIGLGAFDVNGDAFTDLIVSTGESLRRILVGHSGGFSTATSYRVDFLDVDAGDLPASPAPNLSALVVDDIDRDGNQDFVVAQRQTNRLVVTYRVRPQLQFLLSGTTDEGGTEATVKFVSALGGSLGTEEMDIHDPEHHSVFFLRLRLPPQLPPNATVDAIVYRRPNAGPSSPPSAADPANLHGIAHYRYPIPIGNEDHLFDVMLPVETGEFESLDMQPAPRFLVEFCVIENVANQPPKSTAPMFAECAWKGTVPNWNDLMDVLDPSWVGLPWWANEILFLSTTWTSGIDPDATTITPPDARYFGVVVALKEPKVTGKPSAPPATAGNGVVH